jgi:tetratricopeptide (TPR) repeat protein
MAHQTLNNLGLAYLQRGDCFSAIESLKKSLRTKSDYLNAYFNLGIAHERCGNVEEALRAYERFLSAGPAIDDEGKRALLARMEKLRQDGGSSRP